MTDSSDNHPDFEPLDRTQILIAIGVTAVVLLIISKLWLWLDGIQVFNFQMQAQLLALEFSTGAIALGVALGVGITLASGLVYYFWADYRRSSDFYLNLVLKPLAWPDLIWLGLLPGLSEELLFRGVMLPALGFDGLALVISSLCFGILHFSGSQHWSYVFWATVIGLVLGYGAIATGNLLIPVTAHITTNLLSSIVWKAKVTSTVHSDS
jgi:hypothetical protein